jgi:hypothetical protein
VQWRLAKLVHDVNRTSCIQQRLDAFDLSLHRMWGGGGR